LSCGTVTEKGEKKKTNEGKRVSKRERNGEKKKKVDHSVKNLKGNGRADITGEGEEGRVGPTQLERKKVALPFRKRRGRGRRD